jgi:APA family basic amino acid/polyamine antiporter
MHLHGRKTEHRLFTPFTQPTLFVSLALNSKYMNNSTDFKPTLGLLDATMIVAGSMIGSGIFIVSADMMRQSFSPGWLLIMWLLTGCITCIAALSYGELSGMFPKAGGQYIYLRESYNKLVGFLYGWSFFTVIQTGTIAAVGVAFSKFAGYFFPILDLRPENSWWSWGSFHLYPAQLVSIGLIVLLTAINTRGVKEGKWIQNAFTFTKLAAIFGILVFGFAIGFDATIWKTNWTNAWQMQSLTPDGAGQYALVHLSLWSFVGAISAGLVGSIFSSDAWNNVTFIAGEIKNPSRNIGRSLFLGTLLVTLLYISINLMYLGNLSAAEMALAPQDRVGVAAANHIFGEVGTYIIAAMIMISTFGCNNGLILSGARVYYTMAQDKLFFRQASRLNKNHVPAWALWAQCIWASVLCLSGKYGDLLDYVVFTVMLFYILTIGGIFILRIKKPDLPRPYRAPGYPFIPALYILIALAFCICLLIFKPQFTWPGLILVLLGIPVYYFTASKTTAAEGPNE